MISRFKYLSVTRFVSVALLAAAVACDSPASSVTGPRAGAARFAVASSSRQTSITVNAPSVSVGQDAVITATLWVDGHPLGGRLLSVYVDGVLVDSKHARRLGTVDFTVTGLSAGVHTVLLEFAGDNIFFGSEWSGTITVTG